ncbi:MAG: phosphate ABC transporter permease subunit PstC [Promethearchaeota archaeon]
MSAQLILSPNNHQKNKSKTIILREKISGDSIFKSFLGFTAFLILILIGLMVIILFLESSLSIDTYGLEFLWGTKWDPTPANPSNPPVFGVLPPLLGTLVSSLLAILISFPLSIGIALTLSEFTSKKFNFWVSFLVELLAAIPSVIYGLWGIFTLIPFLTKNIYPVIQNIFGFIPFLQGQGASHGYNLLTGSIILSIMITPTITAISRDIFAAVPNSQREAIIALGATKWESAKIVRKYGRSGVIGAVILGLGRAIGETMAVTMVIGNSFNLFNSLFDPSYTLASLIANEFTEASSPAVYLSALIEVGLVLMILALIVNITARLIIRSTTRKFRGVETF